MWWSSRTTTLTPLKASPADNRRSHKLTLAVGTPSLAHVYGKPVVDNDASPLNDPTSVRLMTPMATPSPPQHERWRRKARTPITSRTIQLVPVMDPEPTHPSPASRHSTPPSSGKSSVEKPPSGHSSPPLGRIIRPQRMLESFPPPISRPEDERRREELRRVQAQQKRTAEEAQAEYERRREKDAARRRRAAQDVATLVQAKREEAERLRAEADRRRAREEEAKIRDEVRRRRDRASPRPLEAKTRDVPAQQERQRDSRVTVQSTDSSRHSTTTTTEGPRDVPVQHERPGVDEWVQHERRAMQSLTERQAVERLRDGRAPVSSTTASNNKPTERARLVESRTRDAPVQPESAAPTQERRTAVQQQQQTRDGPSNATGHDPNLTDRPISTQRLRNSPPSASDRESPADRPSSLAPVLTLIAALDFDGAYALLLRLPPPSSAPAWHAGARSLLAHGDLTRAQRWLAHCPQPELQQAVQTCAALKDDALARLSRGDADAAAAACERALVLAPGAPSLRVLMAACSPDPARALDLSQTAFDDVTALARPALQASRALQRAGLLGRATALLACLEPHLSPPARALVARELAALRPQSDSLAKAEQLFAQVRERPGHWLTLARAPGAFVLGDSLLATDLMAGTDQRPPSPHSHRQADFIGANKMLSQLLLSPSPQRAYLLVLRGQCLLELGQAPAARDDADEALRLAPTQAHARLLRGRASLVLGRLRDAVADLELARRALAEAQPDLDRARRLVAESAHKQRHFERTGVPPPPPSHRRVQVQPRADLYGLLGVDKTASQTEIRKAFHKLALLHHPDKNLGDDQAAAKFKGILDAFRILTT